MALSNKPFGFTLVELLVAISIGGVVLLGLRILVDGLTLEGTAMARNERSVDGAVNAEWTVRQIVGNLAVDSDSLSALVGTERDARFASWCPASEGSLESCDICLFIEQADGGDRAILATSLGERFAFRKGLRNARLE
jgi:prepilin-type N-terminal cleavage/methylation domain-containing protein